MPYEPGDTYARITFEGLSGLPVDRMVQSWAFKHEAGAPTLAQYTNLAANLFEFYNGDTAGGNNVGQYLSGWVSRAPFAMQCDMYPITGGPLGSPAASAVTTLHAVGGAQDLPAECGCRLSVDCEGTGLVEELPDGTRPAARHRGGPFIGPLILAATTNLAGEPRIAPAFITALTQAAQALKTACDEDGWTWCVWSRADGTLHSVIDVRVDDAVDTIRKRGRGRTSMVTVPLT